MKKNINVYSTIALLFVLISCKKNNEVPSNVAGLTVIHLAAGLDEFKLDMKGESIIDEKKPNEARIGYFDYKVFGMPVNETVKLNLYSFDKPQKKVFEGIRSFSPGDCYSLIVSGKADQLDTLFLKDDIPARKDTTTGVRFINMLSTKQTVKINISGKPKGSEVNTLVYKSNSSFLSYPAFAVNTRYSFEITDAESGFVIGQFSYTTARFRNVTYVITGFVDGAPAVDVLRINHY